LIIVALAALLSTLTYRAFADSW